MITLQIKNALVTDTLRSLGQTCAEKISFLDSETRWVIALIFVWFVGVLLRNMGS
jgi:hypothetical protein